MLCLKRRLNLYFKYVIFISLAILYFGFLFRETLHAYEVSKGGTRNPNPAKIQHNHQQKLHGLLRSLPPNSAELKRIRLDEERRYEAEEKKRFVVDEDDDNTNTNNNDLDEINDYEIIGKKGRKRSSSTLNPVYEYSEELHSAIEHQLMARKTHLQNVCNQEHLHDIYPPKSREFFVSPGHNLVWCNVFKAASSTWMYYFNILGGYDIKYLQRTKMSPLELARIRFPRPKLNELNDALGISLSFLTVREPFERLLSGYRDKLEGCRNKFYKVLSKQIIKSFRKNNQLKRHNSGPTFKEFILFLIRNAKLKRHFDEHWTPIYNFCTPCSINYTLIAKVETFQRDSEYIIRQAGLEPLLLGKMPKSKVKSITNHSAHKTDTLIQKYFSKIDRKTLDELLQIYRLDFDLFGYNYTKYYDIVEPPIPTTTLPSHFSLPVLVQNTTVVNLFNSSN